MFENHRIYLRALEENDYLNSLKWRKDVEIWEMVVGQRYFVSEYYEKKWIVDRINSQSKNLTLVICDKKDNNAIGFVHLTNIDYKNKNALLGILVGEKEYWGKGYATEATMQILHYGFFEMGLERIEAYQLMSNIGSIKMCLKCGFQNEGIVRHGVFKSGEFKDLNLMSILREDYFKLIDN